MMLKETKLRKCSGAITKRLTHVLSFKVLPAEKVVVVIADAGDILILMVWALVAVQIKHKCF